MVSIIQPYSHQELMLFHGLRVDLDILSHLQLQSVGPLLLVQQRGAL